MEYETPMPGRTPGAFWVAAQQVSTAWPCCAHGSLRRCGPTCVSQRAGTHWSFAFDVAFTLTVEDFYAAFTKHAESFDPPQPHVIKGRLIDPSGLAAAGLRLYASPPDGGVSRYAQTDANGHFGIAAPAGTYGLSVHSESGCTAYGAYREGEGLGAWSIRDAHRSRPARDSRRP